MKEINLEEILAEFFEPTSQDGSTPKQDLQLAITLNPDLDRILEVMKEACRQTLELAAENANADVKFYGFAKECQLDSSEYRIVIDKQSILDTINQIK